jgi:hypothetical protein
MTTSQCDEETELQMWWLPTRRGWTTEQGNSLVARIAEHMFWNQENAGVLEETKQAS